MFLASVEGSIKAKRMSSKHSVAVVSEPEEAKLILSEWRDATKLQHVCTIRRFSESPRAVQLCSNRPFLEQMTESEIVISLQSPLKLK